MSPEEAHVIRAQARAVGRRLQAQHPLSADQVQRVSALLSVKTGTGQAASKDQEATR